VFLSLSPLNVTLYPLPFLSSALSHSLTLTYYLLHFSSFSPSFFPSSRSLSLFPFLYLYLPPSCIFLLFLSIFLSFTLSLGLLVLYSLHVSRPVFPFLNLTPFRLFSFSLSFFSAPCPLSLYSCSASPSSLSPTFLLLDNSLPFHNIFQLFPSAFSFLFPFFLHVNPVSFPFSLLLSL
jgi:hypothetical protein